MTDQKIIQQGGQDHFAVLADEDRGHDPGETLGDYISMTLNLGYATGIGITLVFFLIVLLIQLNLHRYVPVVFWLVIIGTTTLGTEISDFMDRSCTWDIQSAA